MTHFMDASVALYDQGVADGKASRDAEIKNWSACEAAANIPAVLEYIGQLEQERDQLRKQVTLLLNDVIEKLGI